MTAGRRRIHRRLAALPGVRSLRRPVTPDGRAAFDLYYVRSGPRSPHPLLVVPGGPGAASIALYRGLRRRAAAAGLDVLMVEHRGVGLSRHDDTGADLPAAALTVEQVVADLAAVLDHERVERVVVYGSSYGAYLAAGLGVRHPARIHAMVLDSPVCSAGDIHTVRAALRRAFWDGADPDTAALAPRIRRLAEAGALSPAGVQLAVTVYGLAGPEVLGRLLDLLAAGRTGVWTAVGGLARYLLDRQTPFHFEPDLVERIGYRELDFGAEPDGGPLDPAPAYRAAAHTPVAFEAEPYDLHRALPGFGWPTVVLAGGRDLVTPPALARAAARRIPGAVPVELPTAGHSLLDLREAAALEVARAVHTGATAGLAARVRELDALPPGAAVRLAARAVAAAARAEALLVRAS